MHTILVAEIVHMSNSSHFSALFITVEAPSLLQKRPVKPEKTTSQVVISDLGGT